MSKQTSFINTPGEEGDRLITLEQKARRQEDEILRVFQVNPNLKMTAREMFLHLGCNYELTSIRRGITNLTTQGFLIKLSKDQQVNGGQGVKVYRWKLNLDQI